MSDNISLQEMGHILKEMSDRLTNIEKTVQATDGQCACAKFRSCKLRDEDALIENAINQQREELRRPEPLQKRYNKVQREDPVHRSTSFQHKPTKRHAEYSKRHSLSMPPDKEEERRRCRFRRECLANAIRWNFVEIVKACASVPDYSIVQNLPDWLTKDQLCKIEMAKNERSRLRTFLLVLMEQSYDKMEGWLKQGNVEKVVLEMIWKTYEEFEDNDTNTKTLKCFLCRLVKAISADHVIDYLYSAGIIGEDTFRKADACRLPFGAEDKVWKFIIDDIRKYSYPKQAIGALMLALADTAENNTYDGKEVEILKRDLGTYECAGDNTEESGGERLFSCQCQALCARSLHPVSVMESMSLVQAYMLPPPAGRGVTGSRACMSPDSVSPSSSTDLGERSSESDSLTSADEQTHKKSVWTLNSIEDQSSMGEVAEDYTEVSRGQFSVEPGAREPKKERANKKATKRSQERLASRISSAEGSPEIERKGRPGNQRDLTTEPLHASASYSKLQAVKSNTHIIYGNNVYISHV